MTIRLTVLSREGEVCRDDNLYINDHNLVTPQHKITHFLYTRGFFVKIVFAFGSIFLSFISCQIIPC